MRTSRPKPKFQLKNLCKDWGGPMTRAKAKKLEESLQQVVATIFEAAANKKDLEATIQNALLIKGQ